MYDNHKEHTCPSNKKSRVFITYHYHETTYQYRRSAFDDLQLR